MNLDVSEQGNHALSLGYVGASIGQIGCSEGAAEALGVDAGAAAVAVYFDSREKVDQFLALYDRRYVGFAEVTTYCLD